jgi:hypothetical protein
MWSGSVRWSGWQTINAFWKFQVFCVATKIKKAATFWLHKNVHGYLDMKHIAIKKYWDIRIDVISGWLSGDVSMIGVCADFE